MHLVNGWQFFPLVLTWKIIWVSTSHQSSPYVHIHNKSHISWPRIKFVKFIWSFFTISYCYLIVFFNRSSVPWKVNLLGVILALYITFSVSMSLVIRMLCFFLNNNMWLISWIMPPWWISSLLIHVLSHLNQASILLPSHFMSQYCWWPGHFLCSWYCLPIYAWSTWLSLAGCEAHFALISKVLLIMVFICPLLLSILWLVKMPIGLVFLWLLCVSRP